MTSPDPVDVIVLLAALFLYSIPFAVLLGVSAFRQRQWRAHHKARLAELQGNHYKHPN
jgi:hypothetical protein